MPCSLATKHHPPGGYQPLRGKTKTEFGHLLRSTVEESDSLMLHPCPPLVKVGGVNWIFQITLTQVMLCRKPIPTLSRQECLMKLPLGKVFPLTALAFVLSRHLPLVQ